jgi:hypothetical protein
MNELIKFNEQLLGLPSGALVGIFAIGIGYLLKTLPWFNNRYIPIFVVTLCTVGFMVVAPVRPVDLCARIYWGRTVLIGFAIGFLAWTFHAQILKRWVDPYFFKDQTPTDKTNP